MNPIFLPPDDLPPSAPTAADAQLRQRLEASITKRFYEAGDGVTQALLCQCKWQITTQAVALTLAIDTTNAALHWRILNNLVPLANQLARFSPNAKIHISPPPEFGPSFELQVNEIAIS